MKSRRGFSLLELLIYAAIFAVVTGVSTGILVVGTKTQTQEKASGEVNQQLSLILTTVERLVRQSSLIEKVYEGTNEGAACITFCSLKLRMSDPSLDPTVIRSDTNGVYLKQGAGPEVTLTTSRVLVNSLRFTKYEIAGAHATIQIDTTLTYNSSNPELAISKTLQSAVARASAATFDADLLPNADNVYNIGQLAPDLRWKNGRLSGDLTVAGNVGIGNTGPDAKLHVTGGVCVDIDDVCTDPGAGNITLADGAGKANIGTVDPIYTIGAGKFATYLPAMTGVKEETTGTLVLERNNRRGEYEYVIDFSKAAYGSDLWLFYQITDFGENWENLFVILTPSFEGDVWYVKDSARNQLIIRGTAGSEVTYRLTAPRFDHEKWSNFSPDEAKGFILPEK